MKLPILYKLTSVGKIEEWEIWTDKNVIHVKHGQSDGKKQHITEIIKEGKNAGRSNATTPIEQAEAEAQSKWDKKRSKEYRESEAEVKKMGKNKIAEAGGYLPMLAHSFKKDSDKLIYPVYVQSKIDGIRSISTCDNKGSVSMWFRSGKPVKTMPHIIKQLEKVMKPREIFDGELYIHSTEFNNICGTVRRDKNTDPEIAAKIQYWIYDCPRIDNYTESDLFIDRFESLTTRKKLFGSNLKLVNTLKADNKDVILKLYSKFMEEGYEGAIARSGDLKYEQKRSHSLLKIKEMTDEEYKIINWEEGRGLMAGCVGAFVLDAGNGKTFKAKLKGKNVVELMREYFKKPNIFMGKMLTVRFQNKSEDNIPRFPVGIAIRDYE